MRTPARGEDHSVENRENRLLCVVCALDAVDGGCPTHIQPAHLVVPHDRIRSVEQPVVDERKEKESGLAKLERLVIMERVADTANEGLRRFEALESVNGDRTGGVGQCIQGVLDRLVLVPITTASRLKVINQEGENVVRILDPWQPYIPLICTAHDEARNVPLPLLREGGRNWSPHYGAEQFVTLFRGTVPSERGDEFYDDDSVVDLFEGRSGFPERLSELPVDSFDLMVDFIPITGPFSFA